MSDQIIDASTEKELRAIFEKIPNKIPLILFSSPGKNDLFCKAGREIIHAIREIAPKISLKEYDLGHKMAKKYDVNSIKSIKYST